MRINILLASFDYIQIVVESYEQQDAAVFIRIVMN